TSRTPVQVKGLGGVGFLTGITAIAGGTNFSLALGSDGTVWAWGLNNRGQVGDGTTTAQRTTPVQVSGFGTGSGIIAIAAGDSHALALKSDATVWAWGFNTSGQVGNGGTVSPQRTPVQSGPGILTGVTGIAAGNSHSLAVRTDGTLWAWGLNGSGQLGDGTSMQQNTPIQLNTIAGVSGIAAGAFHSLASKSDNSLWAWGTNTNGQLGDGSLENRSTPIQSVVTGAQKIAG